MQSSESSCPHCGRDMKREGKKVKCGKCGFEEKYKERASMLAFGYFERYTA